MLRKPIYEFELDQLGIDKVPNDATVIINNGGVLIEVKKTSSTGLTATSTGADFLKDDSLYFGLNSDGLLLDETTIPKLSDVGIVGLNPIAYLMPDGSIVGESDNGSFVKCANGDLTCRGNSKINSAAVTEGKIGVAYPLIFKSGTKAILSGNGSIATSSSLSIAVYEFVSDDCTNSVFVVRGIALSDSTPIFTGVGYFMYWIAKGVWK